MAQIDLVLRIPASRQATLEIELQELFGLQVDDVFPSPQEGEIILSFRIEAGQAGVNAPLQHYLKRQQAAGIILEAASNQLEGETEADEDEEGDAEVSEEREASEAIACAQSALETLSEERIQNEFGTGPTDVTFEALNAFIDAQRTRLEQCAPEPGEPLPAPRVQSSRVYVLDEQRAAEFDAKRPPARKRFAGLLPGSNAYLLEFDAFDPQEYPDLDPGDPEPGCLVSLDPESLSEKHRQGLIAGLRDLGYALSIFPDSLLLTAWHRDVLMETVEHDLRRILATLGPTPAGQAARAYPITGVEEGDLRECGFTEEEVVLLGEHLPEFASKMADVYLETRFWDDLRFFAEAALKRVSSSE